MAWAFDWIHNWNNPSASTKNLALIKVGGMNLAYPVEITFRTM